MMERRNMGFHITPKSTLQRMNEKRNPHKENLELDIANQPPGLVLPFSSTFSNTSSGFMTSQVKVKT